MDLLATSLAVFLMLFIATAYFSESTENAVSETMAFRLNKSAIFLGDALVKNSSKETLFGSAMFDELKRRVKSNELDYGMLLRAEPVSFDEFSVQGLYVNRQGKKETVFDLAHGGNCVVVERAVLIEGQIALVGVKACEPAGIHKH